MQPFSKQRIGKHASTTIDIVGNGVFCSVRAKWLQRKELEQPVQLSSSKKAEKKWRYSWVVSWQEFCMGGCEDRTWGREDEESPLLDAVARERLITQQAGKGLAGAVMIGELWRSAVALLITCSSE
jgi:hypothetical protein